MDLEPGEIARYARHLTLPQVGLAGQKRLKAASVLCIGAGGLGSPALLYLAAAGIGRIGVVDGDTVDVTNLQRQVLHSTDSVGIPKTESAQKVLSGLNPHTLLETYPQRLVPANALSLFADYDIILDGSDNFATRYLVNDACVLLKKPNVHGSIYRFEGQATVWDARTGPCYRCLFPDPPPPDQYPSCAEAGVLGVLPGIIGTIQANEAIKLALGIGTPLTGRLLLFDALAMRFREVRLAKNPDCAVCGKSPRITEIDPNRIEYQEFCPPAATPTEKEGTQTMEEITPTELKAKQDRGDHFLLIDVREPYEEQIARIPGARLIPLGTLPAHISELDPEQEIVLHCRSGMRSAQALGLLQQAGFTHLKNLHGGILAWSDDVDPSVPKY